MKWSLKRLFGRNVKCVSATAVVLLLTACGKAENPQTQLPTSASQPIQSHLQNTAQQVSATDSAEAKALKGWLLVEKMFATFEIQKVESVPRERWDELSFINEFVDTDQTTWKDCLEQESNRQLIFAQINTEYTPETKILGPQHPEGIWNVWAVMNPEGTEIIQCQILDIAQDTETSLSNNPQGKKLNLTQDQWIMIDNQVAALTASEIWRDYTSSADWTEQEFMQWLNLRRQNWLVGENGIYDVVVQADFSHENSTWGTATDLFPQALQNNKEWNFDEVSQTAKQFMQENASVNYQRNQNEITAVVQVYSPEKVMMEYTFGIVDANYDSMGRTYLKQAKRISEKDNDKA